MSKNKGKKKKQGQKNSKNEKIILATVLINLVSALLGIINKLLD